MRKITPLLNVVLTVAFLFSVLVQHNDPDGLVWIGIYGAAAAVCFAFAVHRMRSWHAYAVGIIALAWAVALVPSFWGHVGLSDLFGSFEMKSAAVERAREFGGLLIVAAWMFSLAMSNRWRVLRPSSNETGRGTSS